MQCSSLGTELYSSGLGQRTTPQPSRSHFPSVVISYQTPVPSQTDAHCLAAFEHNLHSVNISTCLQETQSSQERKFFMVEGG